MGASRRGLRREKELARMVGGREREHRIYQNRLFLSLFRERDFQWLPEEFCV